MKKHRKLILALLLLNLILLSSGCLKTRSQIRQATGAPSEVESGEETDSVEPVTKKGSHPKYELEEIKVELAKVAGKVEEVEYAQKSQNILELKEYLTRIDARVAELEKNQTALTEALEALKESAPQTKKDSSASAAKKASFIKEGFDHLEDKDFESAANAFQEALDQKLKPKESSEANFGMGEAQFALKNYKKAIVNYSKVQEVNNKSPRVPASLYKIGLSFQALNMNKEAKNFFAELVEKFPKSAEAKKAKVKLSK